MATVNIALCITDLELGGAERCLTELAVRLDRERFEPIVYCLSPLPGDAENSCAARLVSADVPVVSLGARSPLDTPRALLRLTGHFRRQRPAVVQSFLFHANLIARIAARRAGVPRVVSGIRVAEPRRWHLWLDRATHRMVDTYVCVSRSVAEFSRTAGRLPAEKLLVIPNGIDLDAYPAPRPVDRAELGVPDDARLVVCIGRLTEQKGQARMLRTADDWLADLGDVHLLLVGDGPDRRRLESLARGSTAAERIHFAGRRGDVPAVLAASDLLVLPSRWEGMPNVVLEAMASGLPVVASDVEGIAELLGDMGSEQVVPAGDAAGWAATLRRLLTDRSLAGRLGAENRRRVAERFRIQSVVEQYERLWWELAIR